MRTMILATLLLTGLAVSTVQAAVAPPQVTTTQSDWVNG